MKTFRVLFWTPEFTFLEFLKGRAQWKDIDVLDNGISGHTFFWNSVLHPTQIKLLWKLRSAHAEIWTSCENAFETGLGYEKSKDKFYWGLCWTSTMRPPDKGCVVRPASQVLTHPHRWYYYECEVEDNAYDGMITGMQELIDENPGYGMKEIASFFLPWRINSKAYICSEFTQYALWCTYLFQKEEVWSPLLLSWNLYQLAKTKLGIRGPFALDTGRKIA